MTHPLTLLPRPGAAYTPRAPIRGPSEESFRETFGTLLPSVRYFHTGVARAAIYVFEPTVPSSTSTDVTHVPRATDAGPSRILLLHGVQTPALGLVPLTSQLRAQFPRATFALLELWGHGLSDAPVVPYEGALFWGLVDGAMRALGWDDDEEEGKRVAVVGYSFGAVVAMGWAVSASISAKEKEKTPKSTKKHQTLHSLALVAPAGLLRKSHFTPTQRAWLSRDGNPVDEDAAAAWIIRTLEGGDVRVPPDWRERVHRGEVVAEKLREWQMLHHPGHAASVVGIFRDAGVLDNDGLFEQTAKLGVPCVFVLGGEDELSSREEVGGFGFDVKVVPDAGHGVVRERAGEVADYVGQFWRGIR